MVRQLAVNPALMVRVAATDIGMLSSNYYVWAKIFA
jgi:hypothetical protein